MMKLKNLNYAGAKASCAKMDGYLVAWNTCVTVALGGGLNIAALPPP
jgi:hypothetical protein